MRTAGFQCERKWAILGDMLNVSDDVNQNICVQRKIEFKGMYKPFLCQRDVTLNINVP